MTDGLDAIARWIDALREDADEAAAREVFGDAAIAELREFFAKVDVEESRRQRGAAIEACVWMAHADRVLHDGEIAILERLIRSSGLPWSAQQALIGATRNVPDINEVAERLTQPRLRIMIVELAREIALADGELADEEKDALEQLRRAFA